MDTHAPALNSAASGVWAATDPLTRRWADALNFEAGHSAGSERMQRRRRHRTSSKSAVAAFSTALMSGILHLRVTLCFNTGLAPAPAAGTWVQKKPRCDDFENHHSATLLHSLAQETLHRLTKAPPSGGRGGGKPAQPLSFSFYLSALPPPYAPTSARAAQPRTALLKRPPRRGGSDIDIGDNTWDNQFCDPPKHAPPQPGYHATSTVRYRT